MDGCMGGCMAAWIHRQADRQNLERASCLQRTELTYLPLLSHSLHTSLLLPLTSYALSYLGGFVRTAPSAWKLPLLPTLLTLSCLLGMNRIPQGIPFSPPIELSSFSSSLECCFVLFRRTFSLQLQTYLHVTFTLTCRKQV